MIRHIVRCLALIKPWTTEIRPVYLLFIVTPIVKVCNCSMFICTLLYVHSSFAIILMGKIELIALLSLSSCCHVSVVGSSSRCHGFFCSLLIVIFTDHTHLLFLHNHKKDPHKIAALERSV